MHGTLVVLCLLLSVAGAFMIHNTQSSLCLEATPAGGVVLANCTVDSDSQQWVWVDRFMLMCIASSRCLTAKNREYLHTGPCQELEIDPEALTWDCDRDRLISRHTSMQLSTEGQRLSLSSGSKHSKWRSLDKGDICQMQQRSKRSSDDDLEFAEKQTGSVEDQMTDEQREYLRWYYRTEDPTMWKFVLLGLAFVCLLVGFLLLGMGAMASKNRKKIAKYKAAAALAHRCDMKELQVISLPGDNGVDKPSLQTPSQTSQSNCHSSNLKTGEIVVTWKDGNTSCLYPEPTAESGLSVEEKKEEEEEISTVAVEANGGGE